MSKSSCNMHQSKAGENGRYREPLNTEGCCQQWQGHEGGAPASSGHASSSETLACSSTSVELEKGTARRKRAPKQTKEWHVYARVALC